MSTYSVYLYNANGARLAALPFLSLTYRLAVCAIGALEVEVPSDFNMSFLSRDAQIEVWRSVDGGAEYLEGEKKWLIRKWSQSLGRDKRIVISAVCPNDILRRRIVAYEAETAFTNKFANADDVLKAYARQNFVTIDAARDVEGSADISSLFAVQPNVGLASLLTVAAARDNFLEVARKICEAATNLAPYLAFDVVWTGFQFELRTYTGQRGNDRRGAVILGTEFGNFTDGIYTEDYTGEITVVIGGAQGVGSTRVIAALSDHARVAASPFGQIEYFTQANGTGYDPTALDDLVEGTLRAGRPVRTVTGRVTDTPGTKYGREWFWGDQVTVQVGGVNYDARLDVVTVTIAGGKETIDAGVRINDE
jgi:hypothetical protein